MTKRAASTAPSASSATFAWEALEAILAEPNLSDMLTAYWEELSPLKELVPLAPNWERMRQLEALGLYRVWTARQAGRLAGFLTFYVQPHLCYSRTLFATDGGYYLAPEFRGKGMVGYKMWDSALAALRLLGVEVVMAHDNAARPLPAFFRRLGFVPQGALYWRAL